MPWVVEFGGQPNFRTWDTRVLDTGANLSFVAIRELELDQNLLSINLAYFTNRSINVPVSFAEGDLNSFLYLIGR